MSQEERARKHLQREFERRAQQAHEARKMMLRPIARAVREVFMAHWRWPA